MLAFVKQVDATVAKGLSVHVILDNPSAHKPPEAASMAHKNHVAALHPTSSSWLNLVDRWFKELIDKRCVAECSPLSTTSPRPSRSGPTTGNSDPQTFVWKATADDIIKQVSRGRETLHQIRLSTDHQTATRTAGVTSNRSRLNSTPDPPQLRSEAKIVLLSFTYIPI